ncbi:MAG: sugar phosphate isomerase/epimerase [Candidatus Solibacter usitatus]|nr:sugar phosphate isomerase/epimerase [Candidatus Solibacter usitatus]
MLTRRECLGAVALLGATRTFAAGPAFRGPIGVQLYTVRDALKTAPEATIQAIAALGYQQVEATLNSDFASLLPILQKNKLDVVSCHFDTPLITGDWSARQQAPTSTWSAAVEQAKAAGIRYMVLPYLRAAERGSPDRYRRLADQLNQAAPLCQKSGITLAYHNHAFEFQPVEGQRPFDILMERMDPKVKLELDVFWVSTAGQDPVALLKQYPGRVALVHLKDKAAGAPVRFSEDVGHDAFKEVGSGSLDFRAILQAAKAAGVAHYFVEQDFCPGTPIEAPPTR